MQNADEVLSEEQITRLEKAKKSKEPVLIVTVDEALENLETKTSRQKTWHFKAENVRDYAFAASRRYIWDAMGVEVGDKTVMAMSYYPNEANPLWGQYSTKAVAHTVDFYSKYTFDYPYPVAISAHIDRMGMEYPMVSFNGYRPEEDGTYSERTKRGLIGVIIHEVGHFWFPMIVNSDERQWTWMDEGLNTYLQFLTEQEWDKDYPSRRGPAKNIVNYMKGDKNNLTPIMTNSESIYQFGNNAYGKPATALNILRETIVGRELFDFAFKEYSKTWMFKHPTPSDFFRILENASAIDLDWFWRGWFYSTDPVDISIDEVTWYTLDTKNPEIELPLKKIEEENEPIQSWQEKNSIEIQETIVEIDAEANDFYDKYDPYEVSILDKEDFIKYRDSSVVENQEKRIYNSNLNYYEIKFSNVGGLVMPIILELEYEDSTNYIIRIPAEIWRKNRRQITKVFATKKLVTSFNLDPQLETADINLVNNNWPRKVIKSRFELYKAKKHGRWKTYKENKMQRNNRSKNEKKSIKK